MDFLDLAAASGAEGGVGSVDCGDGFIGVVHDTVRCGAMWQAQVVADLMDDYGA